MDEADASFALNSARSLIGLRLWWRSDLELTAFGDIERIITSSIGVALGQAVGPLGRGKSNVAPGHLLGRRFKYC